MKARETTGSSSLRPCPCYHWPVMSLASPASPAPWRRRCCAACGEMPSLDQCAAHLRAGLLQPQHATVAEEPEPRALHGRQLRERISGIDFELFFFSTTKVKSRKYGFFASSGSLGEAICKQFLVNRTQKIGEITTSKACQFIIHSSDPREKAIRIADRQLSFSFLFGRFVL